MTRTLGRLLVILSSIGAQALSPQPSTRTLRVLFIGNSLTRANNLPAMVEALAKARGQETVEVMALTVNNFSLEDHWNQGEARAAIARGGWTFIVLQQGPSALPESQVMLRDYTRRFADEAKKAGARTALYMVWPSQARSSDFDAVSKSYALAAQDIDGVLLPAGDAWRRAWRGDSALLLYAEDGFHPSPLGSYLAALTIWRCLSNASVVGLPGPEGVNTSTVRLLQEAADNAALSASRPKGSVVPR